MFVNLSDIPKELINTTDVIDWLIDNNYKGFVNDLTGNNIEYELDDILTVWPDIDRLRINILSYAN